MNCLVTAGPTFEPLDDVRRLTNFSSGRLGTELANFLVSQGHKVTLLLGEQATFRGAQQAQKVEPFSTTNDLRERLHGLSSEPFQAIFHAAAVSDFTFGRIFLRAADGQPQEIKSGKIGTRQGTLLAELVPTQKIISELRQWFPKTRLVGWKYEVDGKRDGVIRLAERQIAECLTDACVANGPAYGAGFGLVQGGGEWTDLPDQAALFAALERFVRGEG